MIQIMKNFVRSIFKENVWVKKCEKRFFFFLIFLGSEKSILIYIYFQAKKIN